jgi:hypothetical protein
VWWQTPLIPTAWKREARGSQVFKASLCKGSETLSQQQNKNKRTEDIAQVLEHLPSMKETLNSISSTAKKTKKKKKKNSCCKY